MSKIGLVLCGMALVLTVLFNMGKIVEPTAVFWRVVINCVVFYLLGWGLELFYKKFIMKAVNEIDAKATDSSQLDVDNILGGSQGDSDKGGSIDLQAGGLDDMDVGAIMGTSNTDSSEGGASKLDDLAERTAGGSRTTPYENKFVISDDFITINDKKIPNNKKLMAEVIKTKLAE